MVWKRLLQFVVIGMLLFVCSFSYADSTIVYENYYSRDYGQAMQEATPQGMYDFRGQYQHVLEAYPDVAAVEAFDFQADAYSKARTPSFWYPQYKTNVVLAIDRDLYKGKLTGWQDLLESSVPVSISIRHPDLACYIMAISYGSNHQIEAGKGIAFLQKLREEGRLYVDAERTYFQYALEQPDITAPVSIMFDYQVMELKKRGRNLEIVIPKEGTLFFVKGLLSHEPLAIDQMAMDRQLRQAGYQSVLSGAGAGQDAAAAAVQDNDRFMAEAGKVNNLISRDILRVHYLYTSYQWQALLLFLGVLILVVLWSGRMMRHVVQQGVRKALFGCGLVSAGWIMVRILKYVQDSDAQHITRWCWYAYPCFEFALGLLLLWIACATDRPVEDVAMPGWLKKLAVLDGLLCLVPLTNDFHQFMFTFAPAFFDANTHYGYGPFYFVIMAVVLTQLMMAFAMLIRKALRQHALKKNIFLPILIVAVLFVYTYGYVRGIVFFRWTETVVVDVLLLFLFLETALRTGLISSNRGYVDLFTHSGLSMQIFYADGQLAYASTPPMGTAEDMQTSTMAITGGYMVWSEDRSALHRKQQELQRMSKTLQRTYALLKEQETLRRYYIGLKTKKLLYDELESIITTKKDAVEKYLAVLRRAEPDPEAFIAIRRLNILACYLKKRCVMLLRGKTTDSLQAAELHMAVEESRHYAEAAGLSCAVMFSLQAPLDMVAALRLYDVMEYMIEQSLLQPRVSVVFNFYEEAGCAQMTAVFDADYAWLTDSVDRMRPFLAEDLVTICLRHGEETASIECIVKGGGPRD